MLEKVGVRVTVRVGIKVWVRSNGMRCKKGSIYVFFVFFLIVVVVFFFNRVMGLRLQVMVMNRVKIMDR